MVKTFSTEAVLSVTAGPLLADFSDVKAVIAHVANAGDSVFCVTACALKAVVSAAIFKQHPELMSFKADGCNADNWEIYVKAAHMQYGRTIDLMPDPDIHVSLQPGGLL